MEFKLKPILIDFNADCASIVKQFLEYRENLDLLLSLHLELSDEEFLNIITKLYNCTIPDYDELIGQMLGVTNVIHKRMEFHFPNLGSEIFTVYGRELKDKKFTVKNLPYFSQVLQSGFDHPNGDNILITNWSSTNIGKKILDSGTIPENITLYNLLGQSDGLEDLEYYQPLIMPLIKKNFGPDRIITDIILYIRRLKTIGIQINSVLERENQAIKAAKEALYNNDKLFDNAMTHIYSLDESISRI